MIEKPSEKDDIYLANVAKIGNSPDNIIYIENVLHKDEHKQILDFVTRRKFWVPQPWDAKTIALDQMSDEVIDSLEKVFTVAYEKAKDVYDVPIDIFSKDRFNLIKFEKDFVLHPHADVSSNESLHIASIYYINDDYEGGEIHLIDHNIKIKPKPNSLIIFPGNENYTHEVFRILEGERYSSSLWFQFTGSNFNKNREWYD
jgi:hypothetical protein